MNIFFGIKNIFKTFFFIIRHPVGKRNKLVSIKKFLIWQLSQKILPYPVYYPFIENTNLLISKGMAGATGNIYVGLHEFDDMAFLLHFLRSEDTFVDVGANIGSYTILASGVIGAYSIAIEPIPTAYKTLLNNIYLNNIVDKITTYNVGAGSEEKQLYFTNTFDSVNHVVLNPVNVIDLLEVPVTTLDRLLENVKTPPCLIKIDVEGFETEVLNGATELLKMPSLKVIIIELLGGNNLFGYDQNSIHDNLINLGFIALSYDPFSRSLSLKNRLTKENNTLYVRDLPFVKQRLYSARKFKIFALDI